jgi:hypothetical protein
MKARAMNHLWSREGVKALILLCVFGVAVCGDHTARAAAGGQSDVRRATLLRAHLWNSAA